jgi:hypothetical protein
MCSVKRFGTIQARALRAKAKFHLFLERLGQTGAFAKIIL